MDTFLDAEAALRGFISELVTLETVFVSGLAAFSVVAFSSSCGFGPIYSLPRST